MNSIYVDNHQFVNALIQSFSREQLDDILEFPETLEPFLENFKTTTPENTCHYFLDGNVVIGVVCHGYLLNCARESPTLRAIINSNNYITKIFGKSFISYLRRTITKSARK